MAPNDLTTYTARAGWVGSGAMVDIEERGVIDSQIPWPFTAAIRLLVEL